MEYFEPINETSYLSVPNAPVYRKIMRCFYREYEKMHFQIYKEDIFQLLKQDETFTGYTMEQLMTDLEALVKWKNLTPIQDPGRVYTIADYKNKQYRYTMSEYAVEIERLTVRLENLFLESGNLSTNFFVRLEKSLQKAEEIKDSSLKEINEWWGLLQEDFKRLNQNYQDYLRDFYSGKTEQLMKSVEFVVHKDKFIKYLNEFVQELQRHSKRIEQILSDNMLVIEEYILSKVIQSELDIPHAVLQLHGNAEPSIQNAALIVQLQNGGISRKDDYRKFLELFLQCEDLEEAQKLSAHVFGVQKIQHFKTLEPREGEGINDSIYKDEPAVFLLKPHTRAYREKKDRRGFTDKSLEKYMQREKYLQKIKRQKEIVMYYIKDNKITFSEIEEVISEETRITFLQWITQANMNSRKTGRTEYGQEYRLTQTKGKCVLRCEDGDLVMPAFVLEFITL